MNIVVDQFIVASHNATFASIDFHLNHTFTPLSKSLHYIMNRLLTANMITLPPICPLLLIIMVSKYFVPKTFCQYHHENGHDTEKCYSLKYMVCDLIYSNDLSIDGSGNKSFSPPNHNPLIAHDINVIAQPSSMDIVYDSKMNDLNHVVNQVEHVVQSISPLQPQLQSQVLAQPQLKPKPKLRPQPKT